MINDSDDFQSDDDSVEVLVLKGSQGWRLKLEAPAEQVE